MANNNVQKITFAFEADTNKAKQSINDLFRTLEKVASEQRIGDLGFDQDLAKASDAALKLGQHLKNAVNVNTGKLDLSRLNQSLKKSGDSFKELTQSLWNIDGVGVEAFNKLTDALLDAEPATVRINKHLSNFLTSLKNTAKWQLTSNITHGLESSLSKAYNYAKDLNQSLNNIRIVTGQSSDQMADFAKQANKAAQALSTSTLNYTDAALIYYQQGLTGQDVTERTDTTIKLANVTGQSAQEVSSYMTAVWNNFDDGSKKIEYFADVITALGASTASSSAEIAEGLGKFASVADTVGLSYEYATSALATIVAQTRQSADTVGTGLRTILARLESVSLGETLDDGVTLTKYTKALEAVGVQVLDTNGQLKKADQILNEIAGVWNNISETQQQSLAYTVGGVRQYTNLVALFDNWDQMQKNIATATGAEGALQEQADIYAESWKAASQRVRAAWEEIYQTILKDNFFIDLTNNAADFLGFVNKIIDSLGGVKGILTTIGSIVGLLFAKNVPKMISDIASNYNAITGKATKQGLAFAEQVQEETQEGGDPNRVDNVEIRVGKANLHRAELLEQKRSTLSNEEYEKEKSNLEHFKLQGQKLIAIAKEKAELEEKQTLLKTKENKLLEEQAKAESKITDAKSQQTKAQEEFNRKNAKFKALESQNLDIKDKDVSVPMYQKYKAQLKEAQEEKTKAAKELEKAEKAVADAEAYQTKVGKDLDDLQQEQINTTNKLDDVTKRYDASNKELIEGMDQVGDHTVQLSEAITRFAGTLTLSVVALKSIKNGLKTLASDTATGKEQIAALVTMAATAAPAITSLGNSFIGTALKAGFAKKSITAFNSTLMASPFAPVLLGLTALTGAIFLFSTYISDLKTPLEHLKNQLDDAKQGYENLKTSIEDFRNISSGYTDAVDGLSQLTKGTDEYNNKLKEANKHARDLIEKYGLYTNYHIEDGLITFDKGYLEQVKDQEANLRYANESVKSLEIATEQQRQTERYKDFMRKSNMDLSYEDDLKAIVQSIAENGNILDEQLLKTAGYTDEQIDALMESKDSLEKFTQEVTDAAEKIKYDRDELTRSAIKGIYGEDIEKLSGGNEVLANEIVESIKDEDNVSYETKTANFTGLENASWSILTSVFKDITGEDLSNDETKKKYLKQYLEEKEGLENVDASKIDLNEVDWFGPETFEYEGREGFKAYEAYQYIANKILAEQQEESLKINSEAAEKRISQITSRLTEQFGETTAASLLSYRRGETDTLDVSEIQSKIGNAALLDLRNDKNGFLHLLGFNDEKDFEQYYGIRFQEAYLAFNKGIAKQLDGQTDSAFIDAGWENKIEDNYKNVIDVGEFKQYREILRDTNIELLKNAELVNEVALGDKRLQAGVQALIKSWSTLDNQMRSGNFLDISEALQDINPAIQNILNMSDEDFSKLDNDLASKYWETITKAIQEGDPAALDQLRESYAQELAATFTSPKVMNEITQQMDEFNAKLDEQNYEIGATIDYEGFIEQCNDLIAAAGWTAGQAQSYFNAIGITATIVGNKVTSAIANANYSTSTSFDSEASRKQRKAAEKRDKEAAKIFKNRDPFHDINISLQRLSKTIEKVNKLQSHLFGADLIKSLEKSNELLIKQDELYKKKIKTAEKNADYVKSQLKDYKVDFTTSGDIADYNGVLKQFSDALKGKEGEEATAIKERYEEVKSLMNKYEDYVNNVVPEMESSLDDNMYQRIANNLQAFEVKISLTLDEESLKREVIDFFDAINENFRETYKLTEEWMNLFDSAENKMSSYSNTIQTDLDKIKTVQDIINNADYDYSSPNAIFASRSEAVHYLEEASKTLMSDTESVYNLYKQTWEEYLNAIEEVQDQWDKILDGFDQVASQLDHSAKLIELLYGGSDTDTGREQLDQLYKAQEENSLAKQNILRAELESLETERKEILAAGADEADKDIRALDEAIQKANEELTSEIESYADTIKLDLENLVRIAKETMDEAILGGSVTNVQQEWNDKKAMAEGYYDSVEKVYQIETMESKWEASLGKASTLKSQQLIAAAMERQISALEEKGRLSEKDIELANKELLVLEAQAALEDAQNNKNSMKLVRGADGNWNYQYVADDADVAQKQQDLLDKMNDYRTFAINTSEELTEKYINNYAQFSERMAQIEADTTLSEEERAVKMEELTNTYWGPEGILTGLMEENALFQQAANEATYLELAGLYEKDQENYNRMTDTEKDIVDGFKEHNDTTYTALWDFVNGINDDILNKCIDVNQQSSEAWSDMATNAMDMTRDIQSIVQEAYTEMELAQTQYDNHVTESEKASGIAWTNISKAIQNAIVKTETYSDKVQDVIDKTSALSDFADEVNNIGLEWEEVKKLVGENISELRTYLEMLGEASDAIDNLKAKSEEYGGSQTSSVNTGGYGKDNPDSIPSYTPSFTTGSLQMPDSSVKVNYIEDEKGNRTYGEATYSNAGNSYAVKLGNSTDIQKASDAYSKVLELRNPNDEWWIFNGFRYYNQTDLKKAIANEYGVSPTTFASGGYTGSWSGGDGRLAMLHSKELVLNAQDTENLLAAVNTIRGLNDAIEGSIQNRMAGMVAAMNTLTRNSFSGFGSNSETNNNTFNITAEFPNANDVNEIREAILSLPNLASQYLGRNN